MNAIILENPGGVEELEITDVEIPNPADDELFIQVKAISINPVEVKIRAGKGVYWRIKDERPIIIGWDISGVVTGVSKNATRYMTGDVVLA